MTVGTTGGIVAGTAITDADDDNNVTGTGIFLQAAIENDVARGLYTSLGFKGLYTAAYWRKPG